jgi:PPM family protein phosphatase
MFHAKFDQLPLNRVQVVIDFQTLRHAAEFIFVAMSAPAQAFRISAATGLHRGDRAYQQDQVEVITHGRVPGCALAVVADGMGGKSGGRKAADQVMLTARQVFERYVPAKDDAGATLRQVVMESHLMIKLTAITSEEEPHSTLAAFLVDPTLACAIAHAGDSRVYHFRGQELLSRTSDHSFVQRLIDEGRLSEEEALTHPQGNLLTGCLGTHQDPPISVAQIERLDFGDALLACSDGLWHYFTPRELGAIVQALPPREASEMLVNKARQRARGSGDNLSLAILRIDPLA